MLEPVSKKYRLTFANLLISIDYDSSNERRRFASRLVELGEEKEAVRVILQTLLRSLDLSKRKMEKKQVAQERKVEKKKMRTARRQAARAVGEAATGLSQAGVGLSQAGMGLSQAGRELSQAAKRPPPWTVQNTRAGKEPSRAGRELTQAGKRLPPWAVQNTRAGKKRSQAGTETYRSVMGEYRADMGGPSPMRYLKTSTSESMAIVKVEQDAHLAAPEAMEGTGSEYFVREQEGFGGGVRIKPEEA